MKKVKLLLVIGLLVFGTSPIYAQLEETRSLAAFSKIKIQGEMSVVLEPGNSGEIQIESDFLPTEEIKTKVSKKGVLVVKRKIHVFNEMKYLDDNGSRISNRYRVKISYQNLDMVYNSGSGKVYLPKALEGPSLTVRNSGSGKMEFENLNMKDMSLKVSGSGKIKVNEGNCEHLITQVRGSGDIHCLGLKTKKGESRISGSGDIYMHVSESLEAKVNGSGNIRYTGQPGSNFTKVSGSGNIRPMEQSK